ncbi:MAG: HYR domain-containing protein [Saprospirales bacterium]|nr:HYR domain-containing protein [Saprospirales bacterium]
MKKRTQIHQQNAKSNNWKKTWLVFSLCSTLLSLGLSLSAQTPVVTVRFANPQYDCNTGDYCLDVEFQSNTPGEELFGMNVRFFYDDDILELIGYGDYQGGYGPVAPNPPGISTSPPAGPAWFSFPGPAEFANGAIAKVNASAPPIILALNTSNVWTKLFQVCFHVDDPNPDPNNFCPSVVWDLEQDPTNGGFPAGDNGVVITLVNGANSKPSDENVVQYNWQYIGTGNAPFGEPIENVCIAFNCASIIDLSLDIEVDNPTPVAGSQVVFTITLNNAPGLDDALNVFVTSLLPNGYTWDSDDSGGDYNPGTGLWNVGTLASGATTILNITATVLPVGNYLTLAEVTAADGNDLDSTPGNGVDTDGDMVVINDPGDEDDGDGATVILQASTPKLQVLKTDALDLGGDGICNVGDVIYYTITVTNTGNVPISNITLSDPNASGLSCTPVTPITLAPGASATCTASHTITQSDINAGFYSNSATATGLDPDNQPVSDISDDPNNPADIDTEGDNEPDDPTVTSLPQNPELQVWKVDALDLGGDGILNPGDVINYTITVTNTGNMPISNISISDPNADPGSVSCTPVTPITLAIGASATCTATHTITQADIDGGAVVNTAIASGQDPNGNPVSDNSDDPDNLLNVDPDNDGEPDDPTATVFEQAIPVVAVRFSNPQFDCANGGVYCLDVEFKSDLPNQEVFGVNVRFYYDDDVLEFLNFGDYQGGYGPVAPNPPMVTTGAPGTGPAWFTFGGPAEFINGAVQLVNPNATPIILSTTNWTKLFQICFTVDDPNADLDHFCPSVVWDLEENPLNGGFITGDDGVVITVVNPDPNEESAATIENVLHHNWTYDATPGTPFGYPIETSCISIRCIDVSLEKSVDLASQVIGGPVVFTIDVSNDGPDDALNLVVEDMLPDGFTYVSDNGAGAYNNLTGLWTIGTLAVNSTVSLQITATVNAVWNHTNLAEVAAVVGQDIDSSPGNGVDTNNNSQVEDDPGDEDDGDGASVEPLTASLSVTKVDAIDLGPNAALDAGDVINYTITVTNTGTAPISNIILNDPNATGLSCTPATPFSLAPGASVTCTASHVITAFDLVVGFYSNSATATGQDPAGQPVSDISDDPDDLTDVDTEGDNEPDDPTVTLLQANPELRVTKVDALNVGPNGLLNPGDVINYTIVVTNTGNVPVTNISLSDPNADPGSLSCPMTNLNPGGSMTCSAVHTITQGDLDAGLVINSAIATGEDPNGDPVTDISDDPADPTNVDPEGDGEPDDPTVTPLDQLPVVTVRFTNPSYDCANGGVYCMDVEFISDVPDQELFGMNVRFFYDDHILEFLNFSDFQGGYGPVAPNPPTITTGAPITGPAWFTFGGPAELVNGAIQLVNTNATPIILSTTTWTKLFQICFTVDDPNANLNNFCPSVVWDLEENVLNGGFITGDDGVVITVVNPDPNEESSATLEQVQHHNWTYDYMGGAPFGYPIEDACILIRCIDVSLEKSVNNTMPNIGDQIIFTIQVANAGPDEAQDVVVTDFLPNGFTYFSDNSGGDYNSLTGEWTIGALGAGGSTTIQITATVNPNPYADFTNLAEVTQAIGLDIDSSPNNGVDTDGDTLVDDDPGDEDDGDGVVVEPIIVADLSLIKGVLANPAPVAGATASFTIVLHNDGPADATGVTVEDVVPSGYSNITNISGGGVLNGNVITWSGLSLLVGNSMTFTFDAIIEPFGNFMNLAQVTASDQPDTDSTPGNGVDTDNDGNEDDDPDDEDDGDGATIQLVCMTCPDDIIVNNGVDLCGANVNWLVPNCVCNLNGGQVVQEGGLAPGSFFEVGGPYTILYVAYDGNGDPGASCEFTITVLDSQLPDITCPDNMEIGACETPNLTPLYSDNCEVANLTYSLSGVTPGNSPSTGINDATGETFNTGLTTITYTVTDVNGNSSSCSFTLLVAAPLSAQATVVNDVNCAGGNDGQASVVNITGGTAPYHFLWSNGSTDQTATGLTAGSYTVTVMDAHGCTWTGAVTIDQPADAVTASITVDAVPECEGGIEGALTANGGGGTGSYTYVWSTGATTQSISGLSAGTYIVTVTDGNGCFAEAAVVLVDPTGVAAMMMAWTDASCNGYADGTAMVAATGGTGTYTYLWSDPSGQTTPTAIGLSAGQYKVTVTDGEGCQAVAVVEIEQPTMLVVEEVDNNSLSCNGAADGSATVVATGGTTPYTYDWVGIGSASDGPTQGGLSATTYTINVTDANGCTATISVTIDQPALLTASATNEGDVNCNGGNDGQASVTASGGTAPYHYEWDNGSTDQTADNLGAGLHTVTVTDANGCTATASVTIGQPAAALSVSIINVVDTDCSSGGGATGSATASPSGGTPGYTYLWSDGQTTATATGLSAGGYTVTVTDANGCEVVGAVTIEDPVFDLVLLLQGTTDVTCNGAADGQILVEAFGGSGGNYAYFLIGPASAGPQPNGYFANLPAGNYEVAVVEAANPTCYAVLSVEIDEPTLLVAEMLASTDVSCHGGSDGTATVNATGGTTPYSYSWNGGNAPTQAVNGGLAAGFYTVIVTDANGCTATASVTIYEPTEVLIAAAVASNYHGEDVSCNGANDGAALVGAIGGTEPYTYAWSNGSTSALATQLSAGTYTVTVTDANGCTATASVTLTQPDVLEASASVVSNADCAGNMTGEASASATGGTAPYTYEWSNGDLGTTADNLSAGGYTVTITDANGCFDVAAVTITDPNGMFAAVDSHTDVSCNGYNDGAISISVSGGDGNYTYDWDGPNGYDSNSEDITGLEAGLYSVVITDGLGCTYTLSNIEIEEPTGVTSQVVDVVDVSCNGGDDGAAIISATGGTTSYNYTWPASAGAGNNPFANGLEAGVYVVTVTDANGCSATVNVLVNEPAQSLAATVLVDNHVSCFGGDDGIASVVNISGGTAPYQFLWSNGSTDQTATGLTVGNYTVMVIDANGCTWMDDIAINQPVSAVQVSIVGINPDCEGNLEGSATATASGGTGPYTYAWSNGQTGATATGLSAGTYMVTATDAEGCAAIASIVLMDPTGITATITNLTDVSCYNGNNGSATVSAGGGSGSYTYLWSNGQTAATAMNLSAGIYTVMVTDANAPGCSAIAMVEIEEPTLLTTMAIVLDEVSCYGANDGSAKAFPAGGTPPYSYQWSASAGNQTTAQANSLPAGFHTVTVTDDNGCSATAMVNVGQPAATLQAFLDNKMNVSCFGGDDGAIFITVTGGTAPYSYNWNNGAPDVEDPNGLSAGVYSVSITDANGCTLVQGPVQITQPALPLQVTIPTWTNANCLGNETGTAQAMATGGSGGYTFEWSNGQFGPNASMLGAGGYTVTVTDIHGCQDVAGVMITDPNGLTLTVTNSSNETCDEANNGTATVVANGGTMPYTFFWNGGTWVSGPNTSTASNLSAGTYNVTVQDANGCQAVQTVTIAQPTNLVAQIVNHTDLTCFGSNDGTATVNASGGTPLSFGSGYTYNWSSGTPDPINPGTVTGLSAGFHTVTVTDANGCTATTIVLISQPQPLVGFAFPVSMVSCNGGNDGQANVAVFGGTPPYHYLWDNGSTDKSPDNLSAGIHTVTVTDVNNCSNIFGTIILQPSAPLAITVLNVTPADCLGNEDGSATVIAAGGSFPYDLYWSNGTIQTNVFGPQTVGGLTAGGYTVTVVDNNDCEAQVSFLITDPNGLTAFVDSQEDVSCFGGNDGEISITVEGGTAPYTYDWDGSNGFNSTSEDISGLEAGTYTVVITDANGCQYTIGSIEVDQPTQLVVEEVDNNSASCHGAKDGSATVVATGGTTPYTYDWLGIGGVNNGPTQAGLGEGTYTIVVTDANGCTASINVYIAEPAQLTVSATNEGNVSCFGGNDGMASASASGGTAPYHYLWNNGKTDQLVMGLAAGAYTVTVMDANGCMAVSNTITITQPATPVQVTIDIIENPSCEGDVDGILEAQATGGVAGYTYAWSNGQTGSTATGLSAGTYTVTATDANGCEATATMVLTDPTGVEAYISAWTDVSCFGGDDGTASVVATGGTPPYNYNWEGSPAGDGTDAVTGLTAGQYTVTITDDGGCQAVAVVEIEEPTQLVVEEVDNNSVSCFGGSDGSATVVATGGTPPYKYNWLGIGGGNDGPTVTGLTAGTYKINVRDDHDCLVQIEVTITQPTLLTASATNQGDVNCNGGNDGQAEVFPNGGTPPYHYLWDNGSTDKVATDLDYGTHTVTVTDANNCTATTTIFIDEPANALGLSIIDVQDTDCNSGGGATGSATASVTGGTSPYTYLWSDGQTTATASGLSAGGYTVTVTDANGCTIVGAVEIEDPIFDLVLLLQGTTDVTCNGADDGQLLVQAFGGSGGNYAYFITGLGYSAGPQATGYFANLPAGNYEVVVVEAANPTCYAVLSVDIDEPTELITQIISHTDVTCNGLVDGTATVNATGGTTDYGYEWDNGELTATATALDYGLHTVVVTDANGCTATASIFIDEPNSLAISAAGVASNYNGADVSCFGEHDGAALVGAIGGTEPYFYEWSNGSTNALATQLGAGAYTVTVTDANGCTNTSSVTLEDPEQLVASAVVDSDADCAGNETGQATASATGGTGSYTYEWSNGENTATAHDLAAGGYSVTITDMNGCFDVASIFISDPSGITAEIDNLTMVSCTGGNDGAISITVDGGEAPYDFDWDADNGFVSIDEDISGLEAGVYTVTITDASGCTYVLSGIVITEPTLLIAEIINHTNETCLGNNDGTATVNATGGTTPYIYDWSNDGYEGPTTDDSYIVTDLAPGTYQVTVTDDNGCTAIISVEILPGTELEIDFLADLGPLCPGEIVPDILLSSVPFDGAIVYEWEVTGDNIGLFNGQSTGLNPYIPSFVTTAEGVATVTVTATLGDCEDTRTFTITVEDDVKPDFVNCPDDIVANNDVDKCGANVWWAIPIAEDNCGEVTVNQTQGLAPGSYFEVGTVYNIKYVADDGNGNKRNCTFTVEVMDMQLPTMQCQDITVSLDGNGEATITANDVDGGSYDNCDVALSIDIDAFDCSNVGDNNVTLTGVDPSGNTAQCVATVTVVDDELPTFTCPATPQYVDGCDDLVPDLVAQVTGEADNCGILSITQSPEAGLDFGAENGDFVIVTISVEDVNGNVATCEVTVTIDDTEEPYFQNCPDNFTVNNDVDKCGANVWWAQPVAFDNCVELTVTLDPNSPAPGDYIAVGAAQTVTYTATDAANNTITCSFTIEVFDMQNPLLTCPTTDIFVGNDEGECNARVIYDVHATDNCGSVTPTIPGYQYLGTYDGNHYYVSPANLGQLKTWIEAQTTAAQYGGSLVAIESAGEQAQLDSWVGLGWQYWIGLVYTDAYAQFLWTNGQTLGYTNWGPGQPGILEGEIVYYWDLVSPVTDGWYDSPNIFDSRRAILEIPAQGAVMTAGLPSGAEFAVGVTSVAYTATDASGNAVNCYFNVVVNDTEAPVVEACPENITVSNDNNVCGAEVAYTVEFSDNCDTDLDLDLAYGQNSGTTFPVGTTEVKWIATDDDGNSSICEFTVTVNDTQDPTIECPTEDVVVEIDGTLTGGNGYVSLISSGPCGVTLEYELESWDNCDNWIEIVTSGLGEGPNYYNYGGIYTEEIQVVDASGNSVECSFTITVEDAVPPVITCPDDITVQNDPGVCGAEVVYSFPFGSDNCPGFSFVLTEGQNSGTFFEEGTTLIEYTITDDAGNSVSCSFDITVIDTEAPVIEECAADQEVLTSSNGEGDCSGLVPDLTGEVVATDNCPGDLLITQEPAAGTTITGSHGDQFEVIITVTDEEGNSSTCEVELTLIDDEAPTIDCSLVATDFDNTEGLCGYEVTDNSLNPTFDDNCHAILRHNYLAAPHLWTMNGAFLPIGTTTVVWTVTDDNENTATCTVEYTVADTEAPIAMCIVELDAILNDNGEFQITPAMLDLGSWDNCGPLASLLVSIDNASWAEEVDLDCNLAGQTVTGYLQVTDQYDNASVCEVSIDVYDVTPPTMQCQDITVVLDVNGAATITADDVDGGSYDNCDVALSINDESFNCDDVGDINVTLTGEDPSGNTAQCIATVTVIDILPPTFTCPDDMTVDGCDDLVPDLVSLINDAADNCGVASISQNPVAGVDFGADNGDFVVVTISVEDVNGNVATCDVTITIDDTEAPYFQNCPGNFVVNNDVDKCGANVWWAQPVAFDNCVELDVELVDSPAPGSYFEVGAATTITYLATDNAGNTVTCSFTIEVEDMQNPEIECPFSFVTFGTDDAECSYAIEGGILDAIAWDNCSDWTLTNDLNNEASLNGEVLPLGETEITWTVEDASGNDVSCTMTVLILDDESPEVVSCPADITIENDLGVCGAAYEYEVLFSDNCDGDLDVTLVQGLASGSTFPVGTTEVVWEAEDNAGNTEECEFTVTVLDTEDPVIECPENIVVEMLVGPNGEYASVEEGIAEIVSQGPCGVTLSYTAPQGTDNCDWVLTTLQSGLGAGPNYFQYGGIYTESYLVTDGAGNQAVCAFTIEVEDAQNPTITCPNNIVVENDPTICGAAVVYTYPLGVDNCPDWFILQIEGPNSGQVFGLGNTQVTYQITDNAGNFVECSFKVRVVDAEAPVFFECAPDQDVLTSSNGEGDCSGEVPRLTDDGRDG